MTRRWRRRSEASADEPVVPTPPGRPIRELKVNEDVLLRPASPAIIEPLLEAAEDAPEDLFTSMPWLRRNEPLRGQLEDFLAEVVTLGSRGEALHWAISEHGSRRVLGLVGLDRSPRTREGDWNLGYWVRRRAQRRGLARASTDEALQWLRSWGLPLTIEISVDPDNTGGLATCTSLCRRWGGGRHPAGDGEVELDHGAVMHLCHLIPLVPDDGAPASR